MPFTGYYGKLQGFRGNLGGVPPWGGAVLSLAAIPGVVIVLAAVLLLVVGVLVGLVVTLPIYRVIRLLSRPNGPAGADLPADQLGSAGRKAVESRVV